MRNFIRCLEHGVILGLGVGIVRMDIISVAMSIVKAHWPVFFLRALPEHSSTINCYEAKRTWARLTEL